MMAVLSFPQFVPVYSGKQIVSGDFEIFSLKISFLFRNKIMEVSMNHLLLQMESNNLRDSCIRFCNTNKSCMSQELHTDLHPATQSSHSKDYYCTYMCIYIFPLVQHMQFGVFFFFSGHCPPSQLSPHISTLVRLFLVCMLMLYVVTPNMLFSDLVHVL